MACRKCLCEQSDSYSHSSELQWATMWLEVEKLSTLRKSIQKQPWLPFRIPKVKEWAEDLRVLHKKKIGLNLKSVNQAGEVVKWTGKQTDTKAQPQWHNIRVLCSWEAKHSHRLYLVFCHNFSLRVKHKRLLKYLSPPNRHKVKHVHRGLWASTKMEATYKKQHYWIFTKLILKGTKKIKAKSTINNTIYRQCVTFLRVLGAFKVKDWCKYHQQSR